MTIDETRRANLLILIKEAGSITALAELLHHNSATQVSQWKNASTDHNTGKPRSISTRSARRLEEVCKKPAGWMDSVQQEEEKEVEDDPAMVDAIRRFTDAFQHGTDAGRLLLMSVVDTVATELRSEERRTNVTVIPIVNRRKQ
jgi:hypothetical protein